MSHLNRMNRMNAIGAMIMEGNVTNTIIATVDTYTKMAGITVASSINRKFSMPANNKLQYDGIRTINCTLSCDWAIDRAAGTGQLEIELTIFKNGIKIPDITMSDCISAVCESGSIFVPLPNVSTNDFFELFVKNTTDSSNFKFSDMQMVIQAI